MVGETATFQVNDTGDAGVANNRFCGYSFAPEGIVSLGPRVEGQRERAVTAVAPGVVAMTVDCAKSRKSVTITVWKQVASLSVTPAATVADGLSTALGATVTYTVWSTSDAGVIRRDRDGLV